MIQVVAAIIIENNKYLIARRASHKKLAGEWEFPGGKIERGETPKAALKRELFEELGVTANVGGFIKDVICDLGTLTIELIAYEVWLPNHNFQLIDHDEITWESIDNLKNYPMSEADALIIEYLKTQNA